MRIFFVLVFLLIIVNLYSYNLEDNVEEHFRYGYELFNAGRYEESEIEFRNLILIKNDIAIGYLWLGKVLAKKGLRTQAIEVWKKGLELEPEHKELRKLLGAEIVRKTVNNKDIGDKSLLELTGKKERIYKVQKGDTFKSLSKKIFGTEAMASKIAAYNKLDSLIGVKEGFEIKIPLTEDQFKNLSQSEHLENKYIKNEKNNKIISSNVVKETQLVKNNTNVKNSVDINLMEKKEKEKIKAKIKVKTPENKTVQENVQEDIEPQEEEKKSEECKNNRTKIEAAILEYNLDHVEEMDSTNFNITTLKNDGYLKKIFVCPIPGAKYSLNDNGNVICSYHSEEGN